MRIPDTIDQSVFSWARSLRTALSILLLVPFLSACGLLFVKGPAVGWEMDLDAGELETMALTQPCTSSKTLVIVDGGLAGLQAIFGAAYLSVDPWQYRDAGKVRHFLKYYFLLIELYSSLLYRKDCKPLLLISVSLKDARSSRPLR